MKEFHCVLVVVSVLLLLWVSCAQVQATSSITVAQNTSTSSNNIPSMGFNMEAPFAVQAVKQEALWNWAAKYFPLRLLRYPGGTISNFWDWIIGWGNQTLCKLHEMPLTYYCESLLNYSLPSMAKILGNFPGSQGMWAINCETSDAILQANFLKSVVESGLPIDYVELGNELYNGVTDPQIRAIYPNSSSYAAAMNNWMKIIEETVSTKQISFALIGSVYLGGPPYLADWNSGIISTSDNSNSAFTLHWYLDDLPYCGQACSKVELDMLPSWFDYVFTRWAQIRDQIIPPWPNTNEIWFTEYNLFDYNTTTNKPGVLVGSWAHALLFAQQTFYIMSHPRTRAVMPHCFDASLWAAFLNISTPTQEQYAASPFGTVFGEIMHGAYNASNFVQLDFSPQIYVSSTSKTPALIGYQFLSETSTNINIVNLSNETISLDISKLIPNSNSQISRCTMYTISQEKMFLQNIVEWDLDISNCGTNSEEVIILSYSYLAVVA